MIRKHCNVLLVTALMLTLLTGCRGNVSHREDGMITDPTGSGATVSTTPTIATMPSTDTVPMDTLPSDPTDVTGNTGASESSGTQESTRPSKDPAQSGQEGRARHAHPRDPMARN